MTPLKKMRLERSQTIYQVAVAVGVAPPTISRIENGKLGASPELAAKLARHFGGALTELQILYPERFTQEG